MRRAFLPVALLLASRLGIAAALTPRPLTYDAIVYSGTNCSGSSAVNSNTVNPCGANAPVSFSVAPQYLKGGSQTAAWTFGDGSAPVTVPASNPVNHTFTAFGDSVVLLSLDGAETAYMHMAIGYGSFAATPSAATLTESQSPSITLTRNRAPTAVTIHYTTTDGTAKAGQAYVAASGDLAFAAGELSKSISVSLIDDAIFDDDQAFSVNFSAPVETGYFAYTGTTVTIKDDDPPPTFSFAASEFDATEKSGHVTVTIVRTGDMLRTASLSYSVSGSAPISGVVPYSSGSLTFAPGESRKSVEVAIVDDDVYEGKSGGSFSISPHDAFSKVVPYGFAALVIADDEPPPSVSVSDIRVQEGDEGFQTAQFAITLSAPSAVGTLTVEGFDPPSADLTVPRTDVYLGRRETSFTVDGVRILGNRRIERDRTVTLRMTSPLPVKKAGTLTIVDDDVQMFPETIEVPVNGTNALLLRWGEPQTVPRTLTLTASPNVAAPATLDVPAGATTVSIPLTGKTAGPGQVDIAFPPAMFTRSAAANVQVRNVPVVTAVPQPARLAVPLGRTATLTVSIEPARPTSTEIALSVADYAIANAPFRVTVPAGGTASIDVSGIAAGTTTLSLTPELGATTGVVIEVANPEAALRRRAARH